MSKEINYGALDPQQRLEVARGVHSTLAEELRNAERWRKLKLNVCGGSMSIPGGWISGDETEGWDQIVDGLDPISPSTWQGCGIMLDPGVNPAGVTINGEPLLDAMLAAAPAQGQQVECQECERLREEVAELDALRQKQSDLLSETAIAVRGPEPALTRYSHADIPSRVKVVVDELAALKAQQVGQGPAYEKPYDYSAGYRGHYDPKDPSDLRKMVAHLESLLDAIPDGPLYTAPQPAPAQDVAGRWVPFAERWPKSSPALDDPSVSTIDTVLVTNNLEARDRMGRMSHVWFASPFKAADGEVVAFTDGERKLRSLTHWLEVDLLAAHDKQSGEVKP